MDHTELSPGATDHMQRAIELAQEAVDRGDHPFGSVLVRDDEIIMEASNRVNTEADFRRHPELDLAVRAAQELTPEERAETTMFTSTEPCPMCAGGLSGVGLHRIVYAVSATEIGEFTGTEPSVRAAAILGDETPVEGPLCNDPGRALHEAFGW